MPTATINLSSVKHNLNIIRSYLKPQTKVLVAIKANAYGHGAVKLAQHLSTQGVDGFGVATAQEALELRENGIASDLLIFQPVFEDVDTLVEKDICLTVADEKSLEAIRKASQKPRVHLKVDTGMGRLGLGWREATALAKTLDKADMLDAVWTHFAASDDEDKSFTLEQLEQFHLFLAALKTEGVEPPLVHASNSAAIFAYPEAQFDMVRPGIAVHGYHSSPCIERLEPRLNPTLTLSAPIIFKKKVNRGAPISYSQLWRAPKATTVATVRIGYGDGYFRTLTGKASVLIGGVEKPIVGRICMDQLMVDVGDLDPDIGERVTLIDPACLNAETLANKVGTISYELLCSLSSRIKRDYICR